MATTFSRVQNSEQVPIETAIGSLTSDNVHGALGELEATTIGFKQMILGVDYTVPAGYFAVWVKLRVPQGVTLTVEAGSRLRAMG
jgi:hypothetical protein